MGRWSPLGARQASGPFGFPGLAVGFPIFLPTS